MTEVFKVFKKIEKYSIEIKKKLKIISGSRNSFEKTCILVISHSSVINNSGYRLFV